MLAAPAVCNCYCRGSEDEERRFRWRYTSVPYLHHVSEPSARPSDSVNLPLHADEFQVTAKVPRVQP